MPIVFAFGCALMYGIADYCGGRASRHGSSIAVTLIGQMTSLVLASLAVWVIGTPLPPLDQIAWGALAGLATAFALAAFYHALSFGSMTVVAPITAVLSAVLPVCFGLVRGERPSAIDYVGMAVAVIAVALVSGVLGVRGSVARRSTIGFACIAGVGFAMIFVALGQTTTASGVWPLVICRVVSVVLMATALAASGTRLGGVRGIAALAVGTGILDVLANVLYLVAVRRGLLSVVVVVAALYPVSTVALAFTLDRERVSRSQAAGMAMALGALVLVSLGGSV